MDVSTREIGFLFLGLVMGWVLAGLRKGNVSIRTFPRTPRATTSSSPSKLFSAHMTVSQKFVVNGVTYSSIDEVPEPYRDKIKKTLEDKNQNGIPDIVDRTLLKKETD